jgi:hypothetical protein
MKLSLILLLLAQQFAAASAQTAEQAKQAMESYVASSKAFLVMRNQNINMYENGVVIDGRSAPKVMWLGPPSFRRDEGTVDADGKIIMAVSRVLQYEVDSTGREAAGATTSEWEVLGFAATWNGEGYTYRMADFSDESNYFFEDALAFQKANTESYHMPATVWETSTGETASGFVGSAYMCWQNETDPLLVTMKESLGLPPSGELTAENFEAQYKAVYNARHSTSGCLKLDLTSLTTFVAAFSIIQTFAYFA